MKVQVFDNNGKKLKEINAPKAVFETPVKEHLIYEAVVCHQANQRQGAAATKTRAMVRGGGRKPWRQKGTGRARAGSTRSPLWRAGGTTFGPHPRDYSIRMPKKAKRTALKSVLAAKLADNQLMVLDSMELAEPRTKAGVQFLSNLKLDSALLVDQHTNTNLILSVRNIPKVKAVDFNNLTVYDVLNHERLVFSQRAFDSLMEKLK
jgi:large subunit ribosomal protein L4